MSIPFISSLGLLEEKEDEKKAMTKKEKDGKTAWIASYSLDVEIAGLSFLSPFQRNGTTNKAVMKITCCVETTSSGLFCCLSCRGCLVWCFWFNGGG